jgi:elongation factor Ts
MLRCALCLVAVESAASLMMPVASTRSVATAPRFSPLTMEVKVDAKTVKALRDQTGAGMMDCKKALVEAEGDVDAATEALRAKGLAAVDKKAGRSASEGMIETYIHTGAKLGVMVEVNCETDFVAKSPDFQELAKALAMQVAACPTVDVVDASGISEEWIEKEKTIEAQSEDLQGKPEQIIEKIVTGRVDKAIKTKLLMAQPYIRDTDMSVEEMVKGYIAKLGENIKVTRFVRFNVGETAEEKPEEDFAAEVEKMKAGK